MHRSNSHLLNTQPPFHHYSFQSPQSYILSTFLLHRDLISRPLVCQTSVLPLRYAAFPFSLMKHGAVAALSWVLTNPWNYNEGFLNPWIFNRLLSNCILECGISVLASLLIFKLFSRGHALISHNIFNSY